MIKIVGFLLIICLLAVPVSAVDFTAPEAPDEVQGLMPVERENFAEGLWEVIQNALPALQPKLASALSLCLSLIAGAILVGVVQGFSEKGKKTIDMVCVLAAAGLLLGSTDSMIRLGAQTVRQLSDYGKLLLPALTAALAAGGGVTSGTALYTGTILFDSLLSTAITVILLPMIYIYLILSIVSNVTEQELVKNLNGFAKWLMSWTLKIILYVFTGYVGITGVVSGTTDAAALKATKLTISGMVPVVGGILSDASEAVLVGAGLVKNSVGIYGLFAVLAIWISPFLQIGVQYLLLKATGGVCGALGAKRLSDSIKGFSSAMGFLLAMTGASCLMLLVSTVSFMKGAL